MTAFVQFLTNLTHFGPGFGVSAHRAKINRKLTYLFRVSGGFGGREGVGMGGEGVGVGEGVVGYLRHLLNMFMVRCG